MFRLITAGYYLGMYGDVQPVCEYVCMWSGVHLPDKLATVRTEGGLTQKRCHELVTIYLEV